MWQSSGRPIWNRSCSCLTGRVAPLAAALTPSPFRGVHAPTYTIIGALSGAAVRGLELAAPDSGSVAAENDMPRIENIRAGVGVIGIEAGAPRRTAALHILEIACSA